MKKYLLTGSVIITSILYSCKKNDPKPQSPTIPNVYQPDNSFKIVAYMPYYRNPSSISDIKYKMITHLFYAFVNPNADGSLKPIKNPAYFDILIAKAKANRIKIAISVSNEGSAYLTDMVNMAANPTARTNFIRNMMVLVRQKNLDGLDIDWEYPKADGSGTDTNYLTLVKQLSDSLHLNNKFLSAAITPGVYPGSIRNGIKNEVFNYVDFFNIMVYDGVGYDTQQPEQHASYYMATQSLNYWIETAKMPRNKAILGIPLYGKSGSKSIGYTQLINNGANPNQDSHTYSIDGLNYFYNGINTVQQKTMLAKDKANGIMFWEFSFDTNDQNSLIKAANDQLGRNY